MDPGPKRQSKRDSAKKNRERSIYTQKAVRAKEALVEKKNRSCKGETAGR